MTIVPGRELKPSGYIEFLEKHHEKDWEQINSGGPFSSTSGYTLECKAQKDPVSVSYDEPYDSSSSTNLNSIADNSLDRTPYSSLERSPDSSKLSYQSEIVTSLTRVSSNGEHIGAVYTSMNGYDRKGIANRSERKGTIACQAMEVQTDALSPASEEELMSSPFPKTDIIVDGHGDTSVPPSESLADPGDHNHSPIYASMDHETIMSTSDRGSDDIPTLQGFVSESQSTLPDHSKPASHQKRDYSSLASNIGGSQQIVSADNVVGFGNSTDNDLNEDEVNMYLEEFEAVEESSEYSSMGYTPGSGNFQPPCGVQNFTTGTMGRSLADELQEAQPNSVDLTINEHSESLPKKFCPDRSLENQAECVNQDPDLVADLSLNSQESQGSLISKNNQEVRLSNECTDRNLVFNSVMEGEMEIESVLHDKNQQLSQEKNNSESVAVFNTVMDGKMEIENILDDKKMQQSIQFCNSIGDSLLQGQMEIEGVLEDAIHYQQQNVECHSNQRHIKGSSADQDGHSLSPINSSSQRKAPGSPMLGVGARPKDPSAIKKNRPNSLLGLSKVNLDFPAVAKKVPDLDPNNEQSSPQSSPNFPDVNQQVYLPPEGYKQTSSVSGEPQRVDDAKQRMNSDSNMPVDGQPPTLPVIHDFTRTNDTEVSSDNAQPPEDPYSSSPSEGVDAGGQMGGSRIKRPTSLNLPHRPGFEVGTPEEEEAPADQMSKFIYFHLF